MAYGNNRLGTNLSIPDYSVSQRRSQNLNNNLFVFRRPPTHRLDAQDVRNVMDNLRLGTIPDWQRDDARAVLRMMNQGPRTFQRDHCQRMISNLAMRVENRYCRPDRGWQAIHHGGFNGPRFRRAELSELAAYARDNERSQRRAMNTGLAVMGVGLLASIIKNRVNASNTEDIG